MEEVGIDMGGQRSKSVKEYLVGLGVSYLIVVCDRAEKDCPHYMPGMRERLFWPLEDPAEFSGSEEEKLEAFREVRDRIEAKILDWLLSKDSQGRAKELREG